MARRVVVLALAVLALSVPSVAEAAPPERITIDLAETFPSEFLTEECGTPVEVIITGEARVTLWRNSAGLIVRESDHAPGSTVTYSAPETGNAFSHPNSLVSTWDYGDGATVGSEVTTTFRGLFGHVTGFIASDAGTTTLVGVVTGFDEFGIPLVDFPDPPIRETGNREPGGDVLAALCDALTDS